MSEENRTRFGAKARGRARGFSKIAQLAPRTKSFHPAGAGAAGKAKRNLTLRRFRNGLFGSSIRLNQTPCGMHQNMKVSRSRRLVIAWYPRGSSTSKSEA